MGDKAEAMMKSIRDATRDETLCLESSCAAKARDKAEAMMKSIRDATRDVTLRLESSCATKGHSRAVAICKSIRDAARDESLRLEKTLSCKLARDNAMKLSTMRASESEMLRLESATAANIIGQMPEWIMF